MFGWFGKKPQAKLWPEARWTVCVDENGLRSADHKGDARAVAFADLSGIVIETNDSGPWGADIWWLLFGADGELVCGFPQGATGDKPVIDRLMKLPGFDFEQLTNAMCSTDNAVFPVWRC